MFLHFNFTAPCVSALPLVSTGEEFHFQFQTAPARFPICPPRPPAFVAAPFVAFYCISLHSTPCQLLSPTSAAAGISSIVYSLSFVLVFIAPSDRLDYSQHIKADTRPTTNSNSGNPLRRPSLQYPTCLFMLFPVDRYDSIVAGRQPPNSNLPTVNISAPTSHPCIQPICMHPKLYNF